MKIIVGKQNTFTYTFNATNKTLAIAGILSFHPVLNPNSVGSIIDIYDVTQSVDIPLTNATLAKTIVAGLPVFTITFPSLPVGVLTADTLLIFIELDPTQAIYSLLQYQKP